MRKTSTQSITSSTTLTNDTALVLAMAANDTWEFEAFILCTSSSSTPDIKYTFTVPTGATITWVSDFQEGSGLTNNNIVTSSGTSVNNAITAGSNDIIRVRGVVTNGSNAGNLQFQWSQNSSNGNATQVLSNSFIKAGKF